MSTDRAVTRSDLVAKDEQWPSIHEADCDQNHRHVWKITFPWGQLKYSLTFAITLAVNICKKLSSCLLYLYLIPHKVLKPSSRAVFPHSYSFTT